MTGRLQGGVTPTEDGNERHSGRRMGRRTGRRTCISTPAVSRSADESHVPDSFVAKWSRPPGNPWARRIYLPQRRLVEIGSDNAPGPILAAVAVVNMGRVGDLSGAEMHFLAAYA